MVAPGRRGTFLLAYLGSIAAVMLLWRADALAALTTLLALSAVHFACDDRSGTIIHRAGLGAFLIAGPALFHQPDVDALFVAATGNVAGSAWIAGSLHAIGLAATAVMTHRLLSTTIPFGEHVLCIAAAAATIVLPPLTGFAAGFVLLHARGQTRERIAALGCRDLCDYLVRVAPLMAGAAAVLVGVALATAHTGSGHAALLFAGIAALATPHMLVTPLWRVRSPVRLLGGAGALGGKKVECLVQRSRQMIGG